MDALCKEFRQRENYIELGKEAERTVYLGGGTPSQLTGEQLSEILECTGGGKEVTIECNPDDLTQDFADILRELPVNRISMGVQSFNDETLRLLRRRHNGKQAERAVDLLRNAGFDNISIDLMYGLPGQTLEDWNNDLCRALSLEVEHVSAYSLMFEEGTPLYDKLQKGETSEADEELSLKMFSNLTDRLTAHGYEHYEISNFAAFRDDGTGHKHPMRSQHNSNYWNQTPYLGLGAAAHSYDGNRRQWNCADIERYIDAIENGRCCHETEELNDNEKYNELILTALRTRNGLSMDKLNNEQREYMMKMARQLIDRDYLAISENRLFITRKGIFVSNMIMSELMMV